MSSEHSSSNEEEVKICKICDDEIEEGQDTQECECCYDDCHYDCICKIVESEYGCRDRDILYFVCSTSNLTVDRYNSDSSSEESSSSSSEELYEHEKMKEFFIENYNEIEPGTLFYLLVMLENEDKEGVYYYTFSVFNDWKNLINEANNFKWDEIAYYGQLTDNHKYILTDNGDPFIIKAYDDGEKCQNV